MIERSWSELEANALEQYQFRISGDPRVEWPVQREKAAPPDLANIVQYYKYDQEKLECCICGYARHYGGAVITLSDHLFRLVGHCCGKIHFGDQWRVERNASLRLNGRRTIG